MSGVAHLLLTLKVYLAIFRILFVDKITKIKYDFKHGIKVVITYNDNGCDSINMPWICTYHCNDHNYENRRCLMSGVQQPIETAQRAQQMATASALVL